MLKRIISSLFLFLVTAAGLYAQQADARKMQFNLEKSGLAIRGYDPVAYFVSNDAVEGKQEISAVYRRWHT